MNFTPMTKQQLKNLLPEGNYPFEVTGAEEKISKNGNPMIALNLRVVGEKGEVVFVNDWLMQPVKDEDQDKTKNKIWKIRSFCYSTGLINKYEEGNLTDSNCLHKKGWVKIKVKTDQDLNQVNSVGYYLEDKSLQNSSKAQEKNDSAMNSANDFLNDDLLF